MQYKYIIKTNNYTEKKKISCPVKAKLKVKRNEHILIVFLIIVFY